MGYVELLVHIASASLICILDQIDHDGLVIIVLLLASLFSAKNSFGDLMDFISYDRGSTFIASAIVLSLLFASLFYILSAKERREEKNMI